MKQEGVLLGSVESELSEFPDSRPAIDQFSLDESDSLRSRTRSFVDKHEKWLKLGSGFALFGLFLWFGPRALISGVMWLSEKTQGEAVWLGCLVQFLVVVCWSVLCIPFPSSIELLSGFLLGFFWGSVVNIVGLFVTCSLSFVLGRRYLRLTVRTWLAANAPRLQTTFRVIERRGLNFLILFRFLAIPFWSRNYGPAALLDCSYRDFAVSVVLATCPFGLLYAYIGDRSREISEEISGHNTQSHTVELLVIGICLAVSLYVSYIAVKIFRSAEYDDSLPSHTVQSSA